MFIASPPSDGHKMGTPAGIELVGVLLFWSNDVTPIRLKAKLAGQSTIAQKVFSFVPIAELWTPGQIAQELCRVTGSRIDMHVLRGCLVAMAEAGLVRVTSSGTYQRAVVEPQQPAAHEPRKLTVSNADKTSKPTSAIDLLAGIAKTLRAVADEIDAVAIEIDDTKSKDAEELGKLRQLQSLLKSLG